MNKVAKDLALGLGIFAGIALVVGLPFVLHHLFEWHTARQITISLRVVVGLAVGYLIYRHRAEDAYSDESGQSFRLNPVTHSDDPVKVTGFNRNR